MSKILLAETHSPFYLKISPQLIKESKEKNNGRLILKNVILQRADAKNQNGRIYPKQTLLREVSKFENTCVKIRNAVGELDHPESSIVSLERGALHINEIWWKGNDVMGNLEVLTNLPNGKILEGYLLHGITVGISSRGMGSVIELKEQNALEVQDDFELVTFDAVSTPSTQRAYLNLNEGNQNTIEESYLKINNLIDEILFTKK